jgi:hypothetical protein
VPDADEQSLVCISQLIGAPIVFAELFQFIQLA